jgi:DNA-binding response OmpR family regulator
MREDSKMPETKKPRIMIVEDDPDLRRILSFQLTCEGFSVQVADNGEVAFQLIQQQVPDCLILDLMMPVMDGFNLLKRIRSLEHTRSVPVIVLTASQDERHRRRTQQYLAECFVEKPYNLQELTDKVRHFCRIPRQTNERVQS